MNFANEQIVKLDNCPICAREAEIVAEMPSYPITEVYKIYGSDDYEGPSVADQRLLCCTACQHMFLGMHLPREFIYTHYVTESSASQGAQIALHNFHDFVMAHTLIPAAGIIDIGANDTTLLGMFADIGSKLIGIDPNIASNDPNVHCIKGYVENCDLAALVPGRRIFLCSHTLEHIYDPRAFIRQLAAVLSAEDDIFMQFPSFELLVRDARFDQVHHQHLNYFSVRSLSRLLVEHGLTIVAHRYDADHYGALMCRIRKGGVAAPPRFPEFDMTAVRSAHRAFQLSMQAAEARIELFGDSFYCFGASLMLPILAHYLPSLSNARSILDANNAKHGLTYINFERPIVGDAEIDYRESDLVVTAVATKAATRRVAGVLTERGARNIVFPLNTL